MAAVEHAIVLAGGIGSRMLPATGLVAKEVLPLVETPLVTHLLWECAEAGVKQVHLVISPAKRELETALRPSKEDLATWRAKRPSLDPQALDPVPPGVTLHVHEQRVPRGPGDAIMQALPATQGPVLLVYGDNLLMDEHGGPGKMRGSSASRRLVERYSATGRPVVGLVAVEAARLSLFGVVAREGSRVTGMVEKPSPGEAPSDLVLCGRYVLGADVAEVLAGLAVEETQTIAMLEHWMGEAGGLESAVLDGFAWYDAGDAEAWLRAQVDHALRRPDVGPAFRAWLGERLAEDA